MVVVVAPRPVTTEGRTAEEVIRLVEDWIEAQVEQLVAHAESPAAPEATMKPGRARY